MKIEKQGFVLSKGFENLKDNLIDSITNPLFIKDINHKWIMINNSFCKILNVSSENIIGKSDYDFFSKEDADVSWGKDDDVLKTGKTSIYEEEITNNKGEKYIVLTSKVRIKDEEGNYYILGTATDVSEMKFDEIQIEKKSLLINAQKNEIKNAVTDLHFNTEQNLKIISNLISAVSDKIEATNSKVLLGDLKNWLNSMIFVHKFFSESFNIKKISLTEYINQFSARVPDPQGRVKLWISGDAVVLSIRYMAPIGLIIAELLQATKDIEEVESVEVEVKYDGENLEIEINSNYPLINEKDAEGDEFGLWDLLRILVNHMDGTIVHSDDRGMLHINIENINVIRRGVNC